MWGQDQGCAEGSPPRSNSSAITAAVTASESPAAALSCPSSHFLVSQFALFEATCETV